MSQKLAMRALIVSDEFGTIHESKFESLREARVAWRTLSFKYASVLFVQIPDGAWVPYKKYGLPDPVNSLIKRTCDSESGIDTLKNTTTNLHKESADFKLRVSYHNEDEKKFLFTSQKEMSQEESIIEVDKSKAAAFFSLLYERDLYFREDTRSLPALTALKNPLTSLRSVEDLAMVALENTGGRLKAWLDGLSRVSSLVQIKAMLDTSDLELFLDSGAARAETSLQTELDENNIQITFFALHIHLPAHGFHISMKPKRFNTYASLYQELLSLDHGVVLRCSGFPRRHLRSKLAKLGAGLPERDLRARNSQLTRFLDDLLGSFPALNPAAKLVVIERLRDILLDTDCFVLDDTVSVSTTNGKNRNDEKITASALSSTTSPDLSPTRSQNTHRSSLATLGDAIVDTYEQVKTDILGTEDYEHEEQDDSCLIFRLSSINGISDWSNANLSERNARFYVSMRVLDDDDEEDDENEAVEDNDDSSALDGTNIYRSAERAGTLEPVWSPTHDFSIFLGSGAVQNKRILIGLHNANASSLEGDDSASMLSYAILTNLDQYKVEGGQTLDIEKQEHDPYAGRTQQVVLDLFDEENAYTSTTVTGEVWYASAKELSSVNTIRRHCILVYEMRQFSTYFQGFSVAWFMCFQCNPDCALICDDGDLDRVMDRESSGVEVPTHFYYDPPLPKNHLQSGDRWKSIFACVPEDVHAPFSHVPAKRRIEATSIKYYDDLAPVSFDELSPLKPNERECKSWHQVSTGLDDIHGYSYATSLSSKFWYSEPSMGSLYRRVAWYRYSSTDPNEKEKNTSESGSI